MLGVLVAPTVVDSCGVFVIKLVVGEDVSSEFGGDNCVVVCVSMEVSVNSCLVTELLE